MNDASLSFEAWTDGSGTTADKSAGIGVVLVANGQIVCEASESIGLGTNNLAEVRAIGRAFALAYGFARRRDVPIVIRSDSAFALGSVAPKSTWRLRANEDLTRLVLAVRAEIARWPLADLVHVPGHAGIGLNPRADRLAGRARKKDG